ncbi:hypothetical protein [Henriciella aquimarina]|uniref:hypothetical protein n=1 Tax=Henriciella aquimarina TaxID=545261 RepID=UPI000A05108C|nr:hypothetical protein [Henriciella aquimarina]
MTDFDRDALVAKTKKQGSSTTFWMAVGALPVIGIAAGLAFAAMPSGKPSPVKTAAAEPAATPPAAAPVRAAKKKAKPAYSAHAELKRYAMTLTTLRYCARGGLSEHYMKAHISYQNKHAGKVKQLRQLAASEPPEHNMSAFEKDLPTDPAAIMVQGMTGQLAMNALQRQAQFESMMADTEKQAAGYLGKSPSGAECTQFRTDVMTGKYAPRLP